MSLQTAANPSSPDECLHKAKEAAKRIEEGLQADDCPILAELYVEKNGKMWQQGEVFKVLDYDSNCKVQKTNKLMGLYAFGEMIEGRWQAVYIGISRNVYQRLRQHGWGKRDNECTLAYLFAYKKKMRALGLLDLDMELKSGRKKIARKAITDIELEEGKKQVRTFRVVLYPEAADYDLYFMEVAIAGILKTKWNSFRTH